MTIHPTGGHFLPAMQRSAASVFGPIQREFDRLFDQLGSGWSAMTELELTPRLDMRDTEGGVEITLEVPGVAEGDLKIAVEGDVLTVSGEKKSEKETKEADYRVSERSYGAFSRSIVLPSTVEAAKLTATMKDGVLTLVAPRRPDVEAKTIKIQPAG